MEEIRIFGMPIWAALALFALGPPGLVFIVWRYFLHSRGTGNQMAVSLAFIYIGLLVTMLTVVNGLAKSLLPNEVAPILLVWAGLNLALILYLLRAIRKDVYGALEQLVGIVTLLVTAHNMSPETFATTTIGFVGGVYVMVRGMTNYSEGRETRRKR